jgi:hypothetical protein
MYFVAEDAENLVNKKEKKENVKKAGKNLFK